MEIHQPQQHFWFVDVLADGATYERARQIAGPDCVTECIMCSDDIERDLLRFSSQAAFKAFCEAAAAEGHAYDAYERIGLKGIATKRPHPCGSRDLTKVGTKIYP